MAKIDAELSSADAKWESSKKQFQVTDAKVDAEEVIGKKSTYESQLVNFGIQQQLLEYLSEYVNDLSNLYELIPVNVGVYSGDAVAMITRHNELVNNRKMLLQSVTEQSSQVQQVTQMIKDLHPAILTAISRDKESLQLRKKIAEREFNRYMSRVGSVPEQERVLTEIGRDRNIKQGVYLSLLQKREENAMELARTTDNGRLADATLFNKKVKPRTLIVLGLALLLGVLLPFFYYFLRRWLRGTVNGSQELSGLTNLPVIGEIPLDGLMTEEAFIRIRSGVLHLMKKGQKTVLVTSDTTGDGKTYTAIHLAVAMAGMGKRVLLCDLDFRHPSVAHELHVQEEKGLCSILTGGEAASSHVMELVRKSSLSDGLDVLVPGKLPSVHPANLLAHENLKKALSHLREHYDLIVLDTSAVGQYGDVLIDGLADVTCYVCRSGKTPKTALYHLNEWAESQRLASPVIIFNQK